MSTSRGRRSRAATGRDAGGFVALPWAVLDSPAFAALSHPARSLLLEVGRQFVRDNNGRLLLTAEHLRKRGWRSADVIARAKKELLDGGFIHETVKGRRPNRASWYAVTWQTLDRHPDYDVGVIESFRRGAYAGPAAVVHVPIRQELSSASLPGSKNARLSPSGGVERHCIAPSGGVGGGSVAPSHGAMRVVFEALSAPSDGTHLDMPSALKEEG